MKDAIAALFSSRKFLIVALSLAACTALVAFGKLPVDHFVTTLTALAGTLTVAIAIEDHGTKSAAVAALSPVASVTATTTAGDVLVASQADSALVVGGAPGPPSPPLAHP